MNIVFVGSVVSSESQGGLWASSAAGNKFQMGLLRGIADRAASVSVIAAEPHAMWRRPGDAMLVTAREYLLSEGVAARSVGFINVIIAKQLTIAIATLWQLIRWGRGVSAQSGNNVILVYNTFSYQIVPCFIASRLLRCKLGVVLADLPLETSKAGLMSLLEKIERRVEIYGLKFADFLIPLTHCAERDFAPDRPSIVVEGGEALPSLGRLEVPLVRNSPRQLVYAGSLNEVSGISLAIEAVRRIPRGEVVLNIYGSGSPEQITAVRESQGESIVYHGTVEHGEVLRIERLADILLLPRAPDQFVTRYTFPSKLLEYLAAGRPVIGNRLEGIPAEYFSYINCPTAATAESWSQLIRRICSDQTGEFEARAREGRSFVRTQKTWERQGERIVSFLRSEVISESQ